MQLTKRVSCVCTRELPSKPLAPLAPARGKPPPAARPSSLRHFANALANFGFEKTPPSAQLAPLAPKKPPRPKRLDAPVAPKTPKRPDAPVAPKIRRPGRPVLPVAPKRRPANGFA